MLSASIHGTVIERRRAPRFENAVNETRDTHLFGDPTKYTALLHPPEHLMNSLSELNLLRRNAHSSMAEANPPVVPPWCVAPSIQSEADPCSGPVMQADDLGKLRTSSTPRFTGSLAGF